MKTVLALTLLVASAVASLLVACGGSSDANKANLEMSEPSHENMSPTMGDGGMVNTTNADLAKPATVNESPAPAGTGH